MLDRFRTAKEQEIKGLIAAQEAGRLPLPLLGPRLSLAQALKDRGPGAIIAEFKRSSPSKGDINLTLSPSEAGKIYQDAGAAAISVLTEETYFKGHLSYLSDMVHLGLPLLRKDFLFHPLQVLQTAATPASALLCIVRMFEDQAQINDFSDLARLHSLEIIFEIFDERDLDLARQAKATIIQVNNRDLDTLAMDLSISERLIEKRLPQEIWISASGLTDSAKALRMKTLGFNGLLIGTSLMSEKDPSQALKHLVQTLEKSP